MTERIIALVYGLIGALLIFCLGPWGGLIGSEAWSDDLPPTGIVGILAIVFFFTALIGAGLAISRPVWGGRIMAASGIAMFPLLDFGIPGAVCLILLVGGAIVIDRTIPRLIGMALHYGIGVPIGALIGLFRGQRRAPAAS